jgi:D-alanyl-D-alanine carboxypeptidase/D-alanyl-D-alanine-endopeptidase (penicillin-binding protein 4)
MLCGWLAAAGLPAAVHAADFASRISSALRLEAADHTAVGICVLELPSGKLVYSAAADVPLKPASNMKLLTTAVALDVLGPGYGFRTECRMSGPDLVVIGGGDPLFAYSDGSQGQQESVFEVLYRWADRLVARGITDVSGDLLVDDSVFDTEWVNPTWPADQLQHHYCAPVGGLNVHGNCVSATVRPAGRVGDPAEFELLPSIPWIAVENRCQTGGSGRSWMTRSENGNGFLLAGRCTKPTALGRVTVRDPGMFFGQTLRAYLAAKGIHVAGQVRRARAQRRSEAGADAAANPLAAQVTPITDVLKQANTESLNLAAEALLKMAGLRSLPAEARATGQGSWANGRRAVYAFLRRAGLNEKGVVVADGSGLSHDNRVTARLMAELLAYMFRSSYRDVYINSLARCGLEGTLRQRMRDMPGRFLGKTGYIDGVRALSGYLQTDDGTWLAVSMIHNGFDGPSTKYREAQEQVCRILLSYTGTNGEP